MPTNQELGRQLAQLRTDNRRLRRKHQRAVVRLRGIYALLFKLDQQLAAQCEHPPEGSTPDADQALQPEASTEISPTPSSV